MENNDIPFNWGVDEKQIENPPLKWWQKLSLWFLKIILEAVLFFYVKPAMDKRRKIERKIKYFKPTIKEGIFGNSVSWELRDTPLTDEQMKNL